MVKATGSLEPRGRARHCCKPRNAQGVPCPTDSDRGLGLSNWVNVPPLRPVAVVAARVFNLMRQDRKRLLTQCHGSRMLVRPPPSVLGKLGVMQLLGVEKALALEIT